MISHVTHWVKGFSTDLSHPSHWTLGEMSRQELNLCLWRTGNKRSAEICESSESYFLFSKSPITSHPFMLCFHFGYFLHLFFEIKTGKYFLRIAPISLKATDTACVL